MFLFDHLILSEGLAKQLKEVWPAWFYDWSRMHDPKDIFNRPIEVGRVVAYVSAGNQFEVAVVTELKKAKDGRLTGYKVEAPFGAKPAVMTKFLRASRELVCLPADWLTLLASQQSQQTPYFDSRLLYLVGKHEQAGNKNTGES